MKVGLLLLYKNILLLKTPVSSQQWPLCSHFKQFYILWPPPPPSVFILRDMIICVGRGTWALLLKVSNDIDLGQCHLTLSLSPSKSYASFS